MKNLKLSSLFVFLLCLSLTINAQQSFGGKIGVNIAKLVSDDSPATFSNSLLFQIGAIYEIKVTNQLHLQSEFLFIQKGSKNEFGFEEVIVAKDKITFNYLDLPILAKFYFGGKEKRQFFIIAGPSMGFAMNGRIRSEYTENGTTTKSSNPIDFGESDGFKRFELSLAAGAGVNLMLGNSHLFFEGRYLLGLNDLNNSSSNFTIKNSGIGFTVGYLVPLEE